MKSKDFVKKKIVRKKPKGAMYYYNGLYLSHPLGGVWFGWFDGEWCRVDNRYSGVAVWIGD